MLDIQSVSKTFKKRCIVSEVSLSLEKGEAVGLFGANGAGKTTTFYMITGLISSDAGKVFMDNQDVTKWSMSRRARSGLGYLPQNSSIFRKLSVEKNILMGLEMVTVCKRERKNRLEEILEEFSIAHIRKTLGEKLSGGERRRVEIARLLATNPSYILLDEPFAGVDPIAIGSVQKLVSELKERNIGVLITDHNVREALQVVDRCFIIHGGQILASGTVEQIINNADVKRFYLGEGFEI